MTYLQEAVMLNPKADFVLTMAWVVFMVSGGLFMVSNMAVDYHAAENSIPPQVQLRPKTFEMCARFCKTQRADIEFVEMWMGEFRCLCTNGMEQAVSR